MFSKSVSSYFTYKFRLLCVISLFVQNNMISLFNYMYFSDHVS